MNSMQSLDATGIGKRYGDFIALDDVHLSVQRGEFLTLLGPSGSGKTTFLMILAGFLEPEMGMIMRGGVNITQLPAEKRNFGMVFQGYALFPHMTVAQNVDFPLRLRGISSSERRRRVDRILDVVGLSAHHRKKPGQLSGGQQQRVAIARALVFEPELLLLDEPLSALDKNMREQLQSELQRIHREVGTSFVFVTHDQGEALALSSRIAIFNQGRLVQVDTPESIYQRPLDRFVAEFIGKMNMLPFIRTDRQGDLYSSITGNHRIHAHSDRVLVDQSLVLAVRPEFMKLDVQPAKVASENSIPVQVAGKTYQGATTLVDLTFASDTSLQISISSQDAASLAHIGDTAYLSWPISAGTLLPA